GGGGGVGGGGREEGGGGGGGAVQAGQARRRHLRRRLRSLARRTLQQHPEREEQPEADEDRDGKLLRHVVHAGPDPAQTGRDGRVPVLGPDRELGVVRVDDGERFTGVGVAGRAGPHVGGELGPAFTAPHGSSITRFGSIRYGPPPAPRSAMQFGGTT